MGVRTGPNVGFDCHFKHRMLVAGNLRYSTSTKAIMRIIILAAILLLLKTFNVVVTASFPGGDENSVIAVPNFAALDHVQAIGRSLAMHGANALLDQNQGDIVVRNPNWSLLRRSLQQAIDDGQVDEEKPSFHLQSICAVVEQAFQQNVTCKCAGNVIDNFSIACDYMEKICSGNTTTSGTENQNCGIPQLAISMVNGKIFSATTCISQYTRGSIQLQDTCVFVDACVSDDIADNDHQPFCGCTASYGGVICDTCQVCGSGSKDTTSGNALTVDCRNVNAEAVSTQCTSIDLDLHLSDGAGSMAGFTPIFSGFCSELENAIDNKISCDCTDAAGGSFNLTCTTNDKVCVYDEVHCGFVESTVMVVDGTVDTVTACATYDAVPSFAAGGGETCTTMQLCKNMGENDLVVCGCLSTYDGQSCRSCELCNDEVSPQANGTASITIDCSNVNPHAITGQCQTVHASSSYEFLPYYASTTNKGLVFDKPTSSASALVDSVTMPKFTIIAVVLLSCRGFR
jgi:hypothetical protein